jgi:Tfp pilus assembly pilus retraction ATPase PilT
MESSMKLIDELIVFFEENNCSDIHITVGSGIVGRQYGVLQEFE